jgi:hypothetical protein
LVGCLVFAAGLGGGCLDLSVEDPEPTIRGTIACGTEQSCDTPGEVCCVTFTDGTPQKFECTGGIACSMNVTLKCDGPEDCDSQTCCVRVADTQPTLAYCGPCNPGDEQLCHPAEAGKGCVSGQCEARFFGGTYGTCKN